MVPGMTKPRRSAPAPTSTPPPDHLAPSDWQRWSTELPSTTIAQLKVRAAQEQRPMCEVLRDAIAYYLTTPAVPR